MLPMNCPKCSYPGHRAAVTNSRLPDQTVRKRMCDDCCHVWYTTEVIVPNYAVGWSAKHLRKPVLRLPMELSIDGHTRMLVSHEEPGDQLGPLRQANRRRAAKADARHKI